MAVAVVRAAAAVGHIQAVQDAMWQPAYPDAVSRCLGPGNLPGPRHITDESLGGHAS
jgi:hypothetical protein